ncbi:AAA family ATPase [Streptomyces sp. NPDC092046]|uniref:AAA family ATPase n=1 Tax=Streptomyces sp. NPDC092046 TaxID=3366009 RepID=UPI003804A623
MISSKAPRRLDEGQVIMDGRRSRLILLCGLPGAGKTTVARKVERELSAVRLCPDEWLVELGFDLFDGEARDRVERLLWQRAVGLLASGAVVILENGFWQRSERDEMRLRARALGAEVELRYLDVPMAELERRIALRNQEPGSVVLTAELLRECQSQFEAPTQAELDLFDPPLL